MLGTRQGCPSPQSRVNCKLLYEISLGFNCLPCCNTSKCFQVDEIKFRGPPARGPKLNPRELLEAAQHRAATAHAVAAQAGVAAARGRGMGRAAMIFKK